MKKTALYIIWILFFSIGTTKASVYYVNAVTGDDLWDGSSATFQNGTVGPKMTIQAAIEMAADQDTILVADGTYTGSGNRDIVFLGKEITVQSKNGPDACILDPEGSLSDPHRAFYLETNSVVDGFTITHGFGWGGGMYCVNSSPTIRNCIIELNSSQGKGGGIACDYADPVIENCVIRENTANDGGGIYGYQSNLEIRNCTIRNNLTPDSYRGGGICCESSSNLKIVSSMVNGNISENQGGGIYCDSSSAQIINSTVIGNTADSFGGGIYTSDSLLTITNCTVSANTAAWYGGGIRSWNTTEASITNCIFWNNQIHYTGGQGAEMAIGTESVLTISYSDVEIGQDQSGSPTGIYLETGCTLNWDTSTNLDADPYFVQEGYRNTNGTSEDLTDDFWTDGDYRLLDSSPCVDQGNTSLMVDYDFDLAGANRISHDVIDMGAYESGDLQVSKLAVKAGKVNPDRTRPTQSDSFAMMGRIHIAEQYLNHAEIVVRLILQDGTFEETIDTNSDLFTKNAKKPLYSYKRKFGKNETGGITSLNLDLVKDTFSITAKQINLSGLQAPVPVEIEIGSYYQSASIVGEDILNQKKYVPFQFLFGHTDSVRVEKYQYKPGKNSITNSDSLLVIGAMAVEDPLTDLTGQEVIVQWGSFEAIIPAGSEGLIPNGTKYVYKRPETLVNSSVSYVDQAILDLVNCTFKILVKNATIGWQSEPVTFGIRFDTFDQSDMVP